MKYQCIKTNSCSVCGNKGTIQAFLNSANLVKYARTRHYKQGVFSYCKLENLTEIAELLKIKPILDQKQNGQNKSRSNNLLNLRFNFSYMAGGEGFEPSTPNLGGWCSIQSQPRRTQNQPLRSKRYPY